MLESDLSVFKQRVVVMDKNYENTCRYLRTLYKGKV